MLKDKVCQLIDIVNTTRSGKCVRRDIPLLPSYYIYRYNSTESEEMVC